jgi:PAS domain S-box-containing protein
MFASYADMVAPQQRHRNSNRGDNSVAVLPHSSRENRDSSLLNERFRILLEQSSDAVVIVDAESGRFIEGNQKALRLFQLSREALLKVGPVEMSPQRQPDNRLSWEAAWEHIQQAQNGDTPVFEWMHQSADGNLIPCEVQLTRFPTIHQKLVLGRMIDLRERRQDTQLHSQLEQRAAGRTAELQAQIDQAEAISRHVGDAIMFLDQDRHILYVNPAWEKLTGYTISEAIYRPAFFPESALTAFSVVQSLWDTVLEGKTWQGIMQGRHINGTPYEAQVMATPIRNESGIIHRFVIVQRDVTEAHKLDTLKTRFIADAAHDLRNPIATLKLQIFLLKKAPEQLTNHLAKMESLVGHLDTLIDDLLTLSRLELGVAPSELLRLDWNQIVSRMVEVYEPLAQDKGLTLTFDAKANLPPILADNHDIERVVTNLVSNALNYTHAGGEVHLATTHDGDDVVLTIQDTGIGIKPEALPHLFERFYRGDEAKAMARGTGLGLPIAKEIIERYDGHIEVNTVLEKGTLFRVRLPAAKPE